MTLHSDRSHGRRGRRRGRRRRLRPRPGRQLEHLDAADAGAGAPSRASASTCRAAARSQRAEGPLTIEPLRRDAAVGLQPRSASRGRTGVGHSLGTIVCQHLAVGAPSLVRSIALFGPLIAPPDTARGGDARARGEGAREGMAGMQEITRGAAQGRALRRHPRAPAGRRRVRAREPDAPGRRRLRTHLRGAGRRAGRRRSSRSRRRRCSSPATRTASRRRSGARDGRSAAGRAQHARRGAAALRALDDGGAAGECRASCAFLRARQREPGDTNGRHLFTNVRIFDGSGEKPYTGEVLVQGNRIARVVRSRHGARSLPVSARQRHRRRRRDRDARHG